MSNNKVTQARSRRKPPRARYPDRSRGEGAVADDLRGAERAPGRQLRALSEDQEFPLARQRAAFPRLPPAVRRAGRGDPRRHRRHGRAGPQDRRHHAPLDRPYRQAADASRTTTRNSSPPVDMLRELMNDNKTVAEAMREGARAVPTSTRTWRPRACSRSGSTRPRSGPGSCSRRAASRTETGH